MKGLKESLSWKCIEKYPLYEVSDAGQVRRGLRVLRQSKRDGYHRVGLMKGTARVLVSVHILVATTFLEAGAHGYTVDHIDRNKSNNHFSNLRWASRSEQRINQDRHGTSPGLCREIEIVEKGVGTVYPSITEASVALLKATGKSLKRESGEAAIRLAMQKKTILWDHFTVRRPESQVREWKVIPQELVSGDTNWRASDEGKIMSPQGRVLTGNFQGYWNVKIHGKKMRAHRLVCAAWHRPLKADQVYVNHIDHDKTNNRADNLEWCTLKENAASAVRAGRIISHAVCQYSKSGVLLAEFSSAHAAARHLKGNSSAQGAIRNCCEGRDKSSRGFIWKYKEDRYG